MTKYEIVSYMAKESGLTQEQVNDCLRALLCVIKKSLEDNKRISIRGLGIFEVKESRPRKGYNIQTKQVQDIIPRKKVKFRMCSWLLDWGKFF